MFKKLKKFVTISIFLLLFPAIPCYAADAQALQAFEKVNSIREQHGLQALNWSVRIEEAAFIRAVELYTEFSHVRPNGEAWYTAAPDVLYGENLAKYYTNAHDVVAAWMASPSHKANIMNANFKSGAISTYQKGNKIYWASEFGR